MSSRKTEAGKLKPTGRKRPQPVRAKQKLSMHGRKKMFKNIGGIK